MSEEEAGGQNGPGLVCKVVSSRTPKDKSTMMHMHSRVHQSFISVLYHIFPKRSVLTLYSVFESIIDFVFSRICLDWYLFRGKSEYFILMHYVLLGNVECMSLQLSEMSSQ